jgi:hypothetical protein
MNINRLLSSSKGGFQVIVTTRDKITPKLIIRKTTLRGPSLRKILRAAKTVGENFAQKVLLSTSEVANLATYSHLLNIMDIIIRSRHHLAELGWANLTHRSLVGTPSVGIPHHSMEVTFTRRAKTRKRESKLACPLREVALLLMRTWISMGDTITVMLHTVSYSRRREIHQ